MEKFNFFEKLNFWRETAVSPFPLSAIIKPHTGALQTINKLRTMRDKKIHHASFIVQHFKESTP